MALNVGQRGARVGAGCVDSPTRGHEAAAGLDPTAQGRGYSVSADGLAGIANNYHIVRRSHSATESIWLALTLVAGSGRPCCPSIG